MTSYNDTLYESENEGTILEEEKTVRDTDNTVPEGNETVLESGTTMYDATFYDAAIQGPIDSVVENISIQKGTTLLDTYTVESDSINGGMGSVWRVHHKYWNTDLAMKRPQSKCFLTEKSKRDFVKECETWINLGLHPNIVSCYYVREISGAPTIFAEWMDGGSLEDNIRSGKLYEGDEAEIQERILDIAIQVARGLNYAHEKGSIGIIHRDVKPGNILLTKEGEVKVSDFGISRAKSSFAVNENADFEAEDVKDINAVQGGYSLRYCSPEQMYRKDLSKKTDIYSWAVSVMEMYVGDCPWANGVVAGKCCQEYFEDVEHTRIAMPEELKGLLVKCLDEEPKNRPNNFKEIEKELIKIYRYYIGYDYLLPEPEAATETADSLNNWALSMLDLGKKEEAMALWDAALKYNSGHLDAVFNYSLYRYRAGKIDNEVLLHNIEALARTIGSSADISIKEVSSECGNKRVLYEEECYEDLTAVCFDPDGDFFWGGFIKERIKSYSIIGLYKYGLLGNENGYINPFTEEDTKGSIYDPYKFEYHNMKEQIARIHVLKLPNTVLTVNWNGNEVLLWDFNSHVVGGFDVRKMMFNNSKQWRYTCSTYFIVNVWDDGENLMISNENGAIIWNLKTLEIIKELDWWEKLDIDEESDSIEKVILSEDGEIAVFVIFENKLIVYDIANDIMLQSLNVDFEGLLGIDVAILPKEKEFICKWSRWLAVFRIGQPEPIWKKELNHRLVDIQVSLDGKYAIISNDIEKYHELWDIRYGEYLMCITGPSDVMFFPKQKVMDKLMFLTWYRDSTPVKYEQIEINLPRSFSATWRISGIHKTKDQLEKQKQFNILISEVNNGFDVGDIAYSLKKINETKKILEYENDPSVIKLFDKVSQFCRKCSFLKMLYIGEKEYNQTNNETVHIIDAKTLVKTIYFPDKDDNTGVSSIEVIDSKSNIPISKFEAAGGNIECVYVSYEAQKVVGKTYGDIIYCWDLTGGNICWSKRLEGKNIDILSSDSSGKYIIVALNDVRKIFVLNASDGVCQETINYHKDSYLCKDIMILGIEKYIFVNFDDTIIRVLGWKKEEIIHFKKPVFLYEKWCMLAGKDSRGLNLVIIARRNVFHIFVIDQKKYRYRNILNKEIELFVISKNGQYLYVGMNGGRCECYSLFKKKLVASFQAGNSSISAMYSTADGRFLFVGNIEGYVYIYDIKKAELLYKTFAHGKEIKRIIVSEDGRWLKTYCGDFETGFTERVFYIDYDYEFPGWTDDTEEVEPFINIFISEHPIWTENEFILFSQKLINMGYGYIRTEAIRKKLIKAGKIAQRKKKSFLRNI